MKRTMWKLCVIAGMFSLTAHTSLAASQDVLWQKAVEIAGKNQSWMPGLIEMRNEELGRKDKIKHVETVRTVLGLDGEGNITQKITMMKDGEIVEMPPEDKALRNEGSKKKPKNGGKSGGSSVSMGTEHFFAPTQQDSMTVTRTKERKLIGGKQCVAYSFTQQKSEDVRIEGSAWLDEESGIPLEVQFSPDPKPKRVKKMINIIRYQADPDAWYPREMFMDVSGGFLLIKKHFRISLNFSDYWQAPPEALSKLGGAAEAETNPQN